MIRICLLFLSLAVTSVVFAAEDLVQFDTSEQRELYQLLLKEYRCLKCQNQNLSDSNASLAGDLRREIRDRILAGMDKPAIDEYLVSRYGEFVLYRPRFSAKTAVLWVLPFVLFFVAIGTVWALTRRSSVSSDPIKSQAALLDHVDDGQRAKARQLLDKEI